MSIEIRNVHKRFDDTAVLNGVSLDIRSGELIALLGPSGSGKTTLLRIIAGMETPDSGSVVLGGDTPKDGKPERQVGFVFQHYALFKHMTVFENVAFGLRVRPRATRPSDHEIRRKVMQLLALVHLDPYHDRYPSQLSGGQRQRVALARALAVEPRLLLLDEPFGALDAKVRKELRRWMRRLHDEIQITSIFVTHDQEEAMEVADRVVVMNQGRIEQIGTPGEVYHAPSNSFVYDFLGNYNMFEGWEDENGETHLLEYDAQPPLPPPAALLPTDSGWLQRYPEIGGLMQLLGLSRRAGASAQPGHSPAPKPSASRKPVTLFVRPHELDITRAPDSPEAISVRVLHINLAGPLIAVEMERRNGTVVTAEITKEALDMLGLKKYDEVFVRPKQTRTFEDASARGVAPSPALSSITP